MSWRKIPAAARAFVVLWLLVQLAIPIAGAMSDAPGRFIWHMFSSSAAAPLYTVTTPNSSVNVDLEDITARLRADLPFNEFVPPHLCATVPEAIAVHTPTDVVPCITP